MARALRPHSSQAAIAVVTQCLRLPGAMGDPEPRSKRRSSGSSEGQSSRRAKKYTLYLDEDSDCVEVKTLLEKRNVRYRTYAQDVAANAGVEDRNIYPGIARRSCIYITSDYHQRYRE